MKGSVKPKGHGKWELVFDVGRDPLTNRRRQRSRRFAGTKREAEQKLRSLIRDYEQGRLTGREMTVSDLMNKWLAFAEDTLSPTTFEEYQRLAVRRIVPAFGDVPLTQLKTRELDDFYKALKDDAGLAASSVRQIHSIIRRCLKQGVKWGLLEHNAAVNATPPPIEPKEVQPPPIDVIRTLVDEATAYDPTFGVLVRLAIATGLRRSELCGLRWEDIDYATATMRVRRAVVQTKGVTRKKSTKTRATRKSSTPRSKVSSEKLWLTKIFTGCISWTS